MQFPRRTLQSIPTLPSVYSSFPVNGELDSRTFATNETAVSTATEDGIEDGLELVPIERSNTPCGKIFLPTTDDKEVVVRTNVLHTRAKPLPHLPKHWWWTSLNASWYRLRMRHRIGVLFLIQISLALAIMGGLISIGSGKQRQAVNVQTSSGPPLQTPSIFIKQGTFNIALDAARQQTSTCLARANESASWACSADEVLQLTISANPQSDQNIISLKSIPPNQPLAYGRLPLEIPFTPLFPSQDPEIPQNGLAYHFKTSYNRTVLLSTQTPAAKNMPPGRISPAGSGTSPPQEGDKPWLCFFNETSIEGFIYVSLRSSLTNTTTSVWNASIRASSPTNKEDKSNETPFLPYTLKLVEQRYPSSPPAYCTRQVVLKNGAMQPALGVGKLFLMPSSAGSFSERVKKLKSAVSNECVRKRETIMTADKSCRCQWMVQ